MTILEAVTTCDHAQCYMHARLAVNCAHETPDPNVLQFASFACGSPELQTTDQPLLTIAQRTAIKGPGARLSPRLTAQLFCCCRPRVFRSHFQMSPFASRYEVKGPQTLGRRRLGPGVAQRVAGGLGAVLPLQGGPHGRLQPPLLQQQRLRHHSALSTDGLPCEGKLASARRAGWSLKLNNASSLGCRPIAEGGCLTNLQHGLRRTIACNVST
jgi:hypothetical protein